MKFIKYILIIAISLVSCDSPKDKCYMFIGDSIVARWDVSACFPSFYTKNLGLASSGVDYMETFAGKCENKYAVLIFGTNDNPLMEEPWQEEYLQRYINAIIALKATHVYLFSVFPRNFAPDRPGINTTIADFNAKVKAQVAKYPQITYIDAFNTLMLDGNINRELSFDGLHLNNYGYEIITNMLLKEIQ